jgi:hypothetical protein
MKVTQTHTTVAIMVLSFAVTIAVKWPGRAAREPVPSAGLTLPNRRVSAGLVRQSPRTLVAHIAPPSPAYAQAPAIEVPPSDNTGPILPLMFAISSHPGSRQDAADDDPNPTAQPLARQVDLVNNSSVALKVTVLAMNLPTQQTTRAELFLPPNAQAHMGSESGLKLESGDQVILRSRGYQELTETVP